MSFWVVFPGGHSAAMLHGQVTSLRDEKGQETLMRFSVSKEASSDRPIPVLKSVQTRGAARLMCLSKPKKSSRCSICLCATRSFDLESLYASCRIVFHDVVAADRGCSFWGLMLDSVFAYHTLVL